MTELNLAIAIDQVPGGVQEVAKKCGVSKRAVYKWLSSGRLPRTDYSGETAYAEIIAKHAGCKFTGEQLLHATRIKAA